MIKYLFKIYVREIDGTGILRFVVVNSSDAAKSETIFNARTRVGGPLAIKCVPYNFRWFDRNLILLSF